MLPRCPAANEIAVRDEHSRRSIVRAKDAYRLSTLYQQRLVVAEGGELAYDRVVALPVARRFSRTAVDDEVVRTLGDLGIEIVH